MEAEGSSNGDEADTFIRVGDKLQVTKKRVDKIS